MKKKYFLILFVTGFFHILYGQNQVPNPHAGLVKWLTIEEAEKKLKEDPRPLLIDVYTDWCGWCTRMIQTTYSHQGIADYINLHFYPVQLDAESHDTIKFRGETFFNRSTAKRSSHDLAIKLLGGRMSYPTTLFFNNDFEFSLIAPGYQDPKNMEPLLVYTVENVFRTTPFEPFKDKFLRSFLESDKIDMEVIKWYTIEEAMELNKKEPRNFLINVYTEWCNSCMVMNRTTFTDPVIASYINQKFYAVSFNAQLKESINFNGQTFVNNGDDGSPFHQFARALADGYLILPSNYMLNSELKKIGSIPYYMHPKAFEPVVKYYGENEYLKKPWEDYQKDFVGEVVE